MFGCRLLAVLIAFAVLAASPAAAQVCSPAELQDDVLNCGTCGRNCNDTDPHSVWTCQAGNCARAGCRAGFYDPDGDDVCDYACAFQSDSERCNGVDDDCDGLIDEVVAIPSPTAVCGVSPNATRPECTSGVGVSCVAGQWQCSFPAGVCTGSSCANTAEICDAFAPLDNDCDGLLNENVPLFGKPCASDDGLPSGHGPCRTTGSYTCNGPNSTMCSAVKANCNTLPGGCTEVCDGLDNDCDGPVDEPFTAKGPNAAFFVKPTVTKISATPRWITSYEASRQNATATSPGKGNGFFTSAPAGVPFERTPACFVAGRQPWRGVTPREVEQVCVALGGFVCSTAEAVTACNPVSTCIWGYAPSGAPCASLSVPGAKFCNLGGTFDSSPDAGDQDAVIATASGALANCWADWSGLQGNTAATNRIFDLTGNLREITQSSALVYTLLGGSYLSDSEASGTCEGTFSQTAGDQLSRETGFRCCFSADPTQ